MAEISKERERYDAMRAHYETKMEVCISYSFLLDVVKRTFSLTRALLYLPVGTPAGTLRRRA